MTQEICQPPYVVNKEFRVGKRKYVNITCSCGKEKVYREDGLKKRKHGRTCWCSRVSKEDYILEEGQRFGRLVVIKRNYEYDINQSYYDCLCDCGKVIPVRKKSLFGGETKSCGCSHREKYGRDREFHGMTGTYVHNAWCSMVNRVTRPNKSTREWYYDKGVSIDKEWRISFLKFYSDMGDPPEGHTLDRIDPSKGYCKENCRWADIETQARNRGLFKNNTSGVTGVSYNKRLGKWTAYLYRKTGIVYLGCFVTKEKAIKARKEAEIKYWGNTKENL